MLKKLSYVFLVIGTIGASISAARTLPNVEGWQNTWQINFTVFFCYIAMLIVGIILNRIKIKPILDIQDISASKITAVLEHLTQAQVRFKSLNLKSASLSTQELYLSLGNIMKETLEPIVDNRGDLIDQFGMAKYAVVFTPFAQAERYLNRAWSAAVDGYKEESKEYLSRSLPLLNETHDILKQLIQPSELKSK